MSDANETLEELKKISKILLLVYSKVVEGELSKLANSDERKIAWVLIDGKRKVPEIIAKGKLSTATTSRFLNACMTAGLAEYQKGKAPRRLLDYVPPSWLDLINLDEEGISEYDNTQGGPT